VREDGWTEAIVDGQRTLVRSVGSSFVGEQISNRNGNMLEVTPTTGHHIPRRANLGD